MKTFAGSAIAQKVTFESITPKNAKWFLLSGATDPPSNIAISRRSRDYRSEKNGDFLKGMDLDFFNMVDKIGKCNVKLWNKVMDLHLEKNDAKRKIKQFFHDCQKYNHKPMLYYSGHGEIGTGDWCFHDGTLSIREIHKLVPTGCIPPSIISDACYSGHWSNYCVEEKLYGFQCLSACPEFSSALDSDEGGELTLFLTGKLSRPMKEPLYSKGNRADYPITDGYDVSSYNDFLDGRLTNTKNILIYQNICDQNFSGIFAPSRWYLPHKHATAWAMKSSYDDLQDERRYEVNKNIYSLACDEVLGFGCYFMSGYGDSQSIVSGDNETISSKIEEALSEGKRVTSCTARGSTYYIIMTKNVVGYHGKNQIISRKNYKSGPRSERSEIKNTIFQDWKIGYAITGICYNHGLKEYLIVMTESTADQNYEWFKPSEDSEKEKEEEERREKWEAKEFNFYHRHPTIYFRDPNDEELLVVYTSDKNRSGYTYKDVTMWTAFPLLER